jgi:NADH-quinone oxidoreductase subunit M
MVNHGLITGALFLLVGVIYERTHDRTIAKMGGLSAPTPVYAAVFGFFVLASAGLPGLSGFVGEFLVLVGSFDYSPAVGAIATLCMILAAGYLLWMFQRIAFGELSDFLKGLGHHLTDMTPVEILTLTPLAALVVVLGLFPGLVLDIIDGSVAGALGDVALVPAASVDLIVPVIAIAIIVGAVAVRALSMIGPAPEPAEAG